MPDGEYFTTFNKYHCKSFYQTEHGIANATTKCKEDEKCAMVSALDCANGGSLYSLCEKSTELIPKLEACTLLKIGNKITSNISKRFHILLFYRIGYIYRNNLIVPHCLDGRQNQDETNVDCGGSCKPCQGTIKAQVLQW